MSPFEALFGRSPSSITSYIQGSTQIASLEDSLTQRDQLLRVIRTNLSKAQTRMKSLANVHRLDQIFKVGDFVLLKLQSYRQTSVTGRPPPKLARHFMGPFRILRRIGEVAYELDLPPGSRIHPLFHISKLKPFFGSTPSSQIALPPAITSTAVTLEPVDIIGTRTLQTVTSSCRQVLVQWVGMSTEEATWEDLS
ncbi:hypothetical protein A2U01_0039501, partial [Trifolium medium]|nr:hypothetical protein [Trifolium medium]